MSGEGGPPLVAAAAAAGAAAAATDDQAMELTEVEGNGEDDTPTPAILGKIWDCKMIKRIKTLKGNNAWICLWCPPRFPGEPPVQRASHNATKALAHAARIPRMDVQICKGNIPQDARDRYQALWELKCFTSGARKRARREQEINTVELQNRATSSLLSPTDTVQRKSPPQQVDLTVSSSATLGTTVSTITRNSIASYRNKPKTLGFQTTLPTNSPHPMNSHAMDVALADFVLSNNLSFSIVSCPKVGQGCCSSCRFYCVCL